jgi:branched-chain amino acid aminotransferase
MTGSGMTGAGMTAAGTTVVWLNGELVAEADATISPFDHGLLVGDGVFESLRLYRGRPFAVRRHLDRLERSAQGIALDLPDRAALESAIEEVAAANPGLTDARMRITVTSGRGPLGSARGDARSTVLLAMSAIAPLPPSYRVHVAPWPRNERGALAGLKTVSYAENAIALAWARGQGADEAVLGNTIGNLCEGTGTNVFVAIGGRLITPPVSSGCLAGVTRDLVVELTGAAEEDVPLTALADADEAFLTGTGAEVMPIAAVDGRPKPAPGPLTEKAAAAIIDLTRRDLDP